MVEAASKARSQIRIAGRLIRLRRRNIAPAVMSMQKRKKIFFFFLNNGFLGTLVEKVGPVHIENHFYVFA